jgi:hypothetical protein
MQPTPTHTDNDDSIRVLTAKDAAESVGRDDYQCRFENHGPRQK